MLETERYTTNYFGREEKPKAGPHFHGGPDLMGFPAPHNCPPRYTMTEEMEHAVRLMRETVDRLLKFEARVKAEIAELSHHLASDNVIFKESMNTAWISFLTDVKNEVNSFESTVNADLNAFKAEVESNYANLSEDTKSQIAQNLATYEAKLAELGDKFDKQYTSLLESVNARIDAYNAANGEAMASFQREIITQFNTFTQSINADYAAFTESVGNTIHEFRTHWEQIITERLAAQDGRISDAELYMKANIGATVRTLIGDMHANGDFTDIIEGEVFNDLEARSMLEYHTATTEKGGNFCASYCRATGRVFYVPYGSTLEVSETLDLTGLDVEIHGTVRFKHNGVGMIVGGSSAVGDIRRINIRNVSHAAFKTGDVSVRCVGLMRGNVNIDNAPVIQLYADGDVDAIHAIGYSTFNIGTCRVLELTDNPNAKGVGWINENYFVVNRITERLTIEGHSFAHDNNVFMKPCIEGASLVLKNCVRNRFYDVRGEGNFTVSMDADTRYNYIQNNFHWTPVHTHAGVTDNGRNNVFVNSLYESLETVPFYVINDKTLERYAVTAADSFAVDNGKVKPSKSYAKLLMNVTVPVDGVSFIGMDSDAKTFQLYATPLSADGSVIVGGLDYTGGIKQNNDGTYQPSDEQSAAFIEIINPAVKYLRLTLDTAITGVKSFDNVTLYALCKKQNAPKVARLAECLKI